jgi:hypothetical protein
MKTARLVTGCAVVVGALAFLTPTKAEPVEYVKICSAAGEGFYYIPGTETCINPDTGVTKDYTGTANGKVGQSAVSAEAFEGAAMSMAMPAPFIESGKNFAIGGNIATFGGQSAVGFTAAARVNDGLSLNGGIGLGLGEHTIGGRAGFNFSW